MTALAPYMSNFLREHLPKERRASLHTCEAYADGFRLLVSFAASRFGVRPCRLEVEQLDAPLILAFLEYIEAERENSARTRNARLAPSMPSSASWSTAYRHVSTRRAGFMRFR
jgi:integrase/recombinase XerD